MEGREGGRKKGREEGRGKEIGRRNEEMKGGRKKEQVR